jgi:hypothetical protein
MLVRELNKLEWLCKLLKLARVVQIRPLNNILSRRTKVIYRESAIAGIPKMLKIA